MTQRPDNAIFDFYAQPTAMTSAGKYADALRALPADVGELSRIIQGVAIHEFMAPAYGVTVSQERAQESHIRAAEQILDRIFALDSRPLTAPRPPEKRVVGVCHHFMMLLLAMLRAKNVPVRGRRGFGAYFNEGYFEDHVVCEYWNTAEERWALADPQFDELWRTKLKITYDVLDVPRNRFLIAADAWTGCRAGNADAAKFGIAKGNLRGLWFVASNLVHDVSVLNKMEMLQWDVWGAMPPPDQPLPDEQLAYFDQLAKLTSEPDANFAELRSRYNQDERLRVPPIVFNAVLYRQEKISA